ncbi:MAG: hypothetical protein J0I32_11600 [Sphingobacteriales bacterium]|nr:hypothetical protein [Sphingobacteriales bacterium]OJW01079.1 MAG: hypothetical protein BGO52_06480 [Sphingobacteriales bacterium 44-61]
MNHSKHFNKVIKISGYAIAIIFILWFAVLPIDSKVSSKAIWKGLYSRFALIIVGISFFWVLYYNIFWKWKSTFLRKFFFDQPDLSGTWMGYLKSDFLADGVPMVPIKIVFFIRQTNFFDIRITSQSSQNAFFSYGEVLQFDHSNNMIRLIYQYSQKKTIPDSKDDQQGAADLFLYEDYLAGHYWTIVKTSGFIRVHKLSDKSYRSFEEAERELGNSAILLKCYDLVRGIDVIGA